MNSIKIEPGFGIDTDRGDKSIPRDEANQAILRIMAEAASLFSAYTTVPTYGGWTNGNGRLVEEEGFTLFTIQPSALEDRPDTSLNLKIKQLANFIKTQLNQEAVALAFYPVDFKLI